VGLQGGRLDPVGGWSGWEFSEGHDEENPAISLRHTSSCLSFVVTTERSGAWLVFRAEMISLSMTSRSTTSGRKFISQRWSKFLRR